MVDAGRPLVERLAAVADNQWRGLKNGAEVESGLISLTYSSVKYASRRAPDEIESVLSFLDKAAIDLLQKSFDGGPLGLWEFLRAVVQTGTYKPDSLMPFVAGAVDLFLEVMWSRIARNPQTTDRVEIHWGDLMNHLLERPEMVFWGGGVESKPMEMYCSGVVDAKHAGPHSISGLLWMSNVNVTATIENGPSVFIRSPSSKLRELKPELPSNFSGLPLNMEFKVLAIGWDDKQDLLVLLSNRMVVQWRLRSQGSHFQQLRVLLARPGGPSNSSSQLLGSDSSQPTAQEKILDRKACVFLHALSRRNGMDEESWLQELQTDKKAMEDATQVAIWWSPRAQQWITSNRSGRLCFWDLRVFDHVIDGCDIVCLSPTRVLQAHSDVVTGYTELDANHFATCSMDQTIVIWDSRSDVNETVLRGHSSRVLSQAYLKCSACLVSVGHERLIHVWSIGMSGCGASRAKLKGHEANLLRVAVSERVFFTLDEAAYVLLWDATYLTCIQALSCGSWKPDHMVCMPSKSRICVAGRRLHFIEANGALAVAMGASPSLEEQALKQRLQDTVKLKRSGAPRWCGLSASRGCFLSATQYEVRFHPRSRPAQPRVVFSAPEGDVITAFCASGRLSIATCCTARGDIYLLKYRSGYVTAVHKTRPVNPEEALANGGGGLSEGYSEGRERARGAPSENSEAARRSKFDSQQASALDASVRCAAICEKHFRVYVGLSEGQVLVIACEPGFPIVRQLSTPKDTSAVTCLHCSEDTGLLAVGTFNGLVHLFMLEHFRTAGSMNIPLLRRRGTGRGSPLQSLHLFNVPVNPELPMTLLTVSESSRVQLWGLRVHSNEGKLALVHRVRDLRHMRAVHPAKGSREERGRQGVNMWLSGHKLVEVDDDDMPDIVKLTAMAVASGRMALPGRLAEGLKDEAREDAPGSLGLGTHGRARVREEPEEVVAERLRLRPRTPPRNRWQVVEVDANRFAFVADSSGWVWCIDIPGSISASLEQQETVELPQNPTTKEQVYRRCNLKSQSTRNFASMKTTEFMENAAAITSLSMSETEISEEESKPLTLQTPVAWLAHSSGVATLTFSGPFPALVTTGLDKDVKVWSTQGDLWGHFNMLAAEGQPAPTVWPPPQVLASQVALMGIAEDFLGGVGRRSSILFHSLKGAGQKWRRSTGQRRGTARRAAPEGAVRSSSCISLLDSPKSSTRPAGGTSSPTGSPCGIFKLSMPGASGSKPSPCSDSPKSTSSPPGSQEEPSPRALTRIPERRPCQRSRSSRSLGVSASKGEDAEEASPLSESTACTVREQASSASPKPELAEITEAISPQQAGDDIAELSDDSLLTSPTSGSPGRGRRTGFTSEQMEQMVQNHAFSSGCRSFQEFVSHTQARVAARNRTEGIRERALRSDFWNRPTSGLGIRVSREGAKGMGRKSASESALLRYVQGSVAEMTRTVREGMGVDVQALTQEQIMRTSFIGRLDLAGVSHDPSDTTSVTSQIATQLSKPPRATRKLPSIFANTGGSVTGTSTGRRGLQGAHQRGRSGAPKA